MNTRTLLNWALAASIVGSGSLPALADQVVVVNTQTSGRSTLIPQTVIPQTAGVVISLPMPITVDVGQHQDYPLTVPLSQPLIDSQGNTSFLPMSLSPSSSSQKMAVPALSQSRSSLVVKLFPFKPLVPSFPATPLHSKKEPKPHGKTAPSMAISLVPRWARSLLKPVKPMPSTRVG